MWGNLKFRKIPVSQHYILKLYVSDLNINVDETEDLVAIMQLEIALLKAAKSLLLERVTTLEESMETSNQNVAELESVVNDTTEMIEGLEDDLQGIFDIIFYHVCPVTCTKLSFRCK